MHYVYILISQYDNSLYTGYTMDLKRRIIKHNHKAVNYTSKKGPFLLVWYCAFRNKTKAIQFEKYLKQGSGKAFTMKRLI